MSVFECEAVLELLTEEEDVAPEIFHDIAKRMRDHDISPQALCETMRNFVPFNITEDAQSTLDGCEKGTEFAKEVDTLIDNLNLVKDDAVLLKLPAYAHLKPTFDKFIAYGVRLSEASKNQVVQEDTKLRQSVSDHRDAQFAHLLARMEAIKYEVQDKKAFRKVKVALLMWLCEREVALEAEEVDVSAEAEERQGNRASKVARRE